MEISVLDKMKNTRVLVYGDFMVDKYINGQVERISPEAPVPVLRVTGRERKFGGAGNVISNLLSLDVQVTAAGYTGNDEDGLWMKERFDKLGADISHLRTVSQLQTIIKTRVTSRNQQFIRLDEEQTDDLPGELENEVIERIPEMLDEIDAVILSDYGKGSVTAGICQNFITVCRKKKIPVIVDPKGSDYHKYKGATVCKPNEKELAIATGVDLRTDKDVAKAARLLKMENEIENLVISRSERGIMLLGKTGECMDFPTMAKEVIDVTGAGDTVVAMIAVSQAIGIGLEDACRLANTAAALVCSKFGAASVSRKELIQAWKSDTESTDYTLEKVKYSLQNERIQGKTIVFTNGCFDLLHAGHLASFRQAKQYGDILVVAVNSDASVRKIKGQGRPIIDEKNRIQMVSALECVDYVVLMEDENPTRIISELKPDIIVKGKDWDGKFMPERETIEAYGGKLRFIELEQGLSTTRIIHRVMECYDK